MDILIYRGLNLFSVPTNEKNGFVQGHSRMLLVIFHDTSLKLCILVWYKLVGREIGMVRVVLHHVIPTLRYEQLPQLLARPVSFMFK